MTRTCPGSPKDRFVTVYGRNPVIEVLDDPSLVIDKVVLAEGVRGHGIGEIIGLARDRGVPLERASAERVKKLAGNGRQDQGVFADVVAPRMRPTAWTPSTTWRSVGCCCSTASRRRRTSA